ncbi:NAD(P)/FAD-dependent oxidoreductase [Silanimonas lenta]|uniref:NAD(P)/FAD-dependent oxidoreductase n=1 Tax=Silanimonas lenta TaxID=265429 RepID=UPI000427FB11|nr:FAD-binding oxidoreductase [Silanimonas lenta]
MPAPSSYYRASLPPPPGLPRLQGRHAARVCIVGAGFAGLGTACSLLERGVREVLVLEAETVAHGASGRNGGFVFAGYSLGEAALLARLGPEQARALYRRTREAVARVRERTRRYTIDCDRVEGGVLWANWFRDPAVLEARRCLLAEHFDTRWEPVPREELAALLGTTRYSGALFEREAFHFHPLKYALGLASAIGQAGGRCFEHSPALALERRGAGWRVRTPEGEVEAEHVLLACGGYLAGLVPRIDAAVLPIATYIIVTEPLGDEAAAFIRTRAAVYDTRFAFDYYRLLPDTRLLWGGRISVRDRPPAAVERLLRRDLARVFPGLAGVRIDYAWSGLMSYARHEMPQLGQLAPGLWYAQAFGGHGVAPTTVAGEMLAAAIAEGDPAWQDFAPFGLDSALKPLGYLGAQATYWWLQARDAWKDWRERLAG